ncbi:MAG: TIGR00725 family protein [Deltaproteobacteria bacterium]|nr:TIGR00725 family protein [Deltaproteobacteria bacterium]
MGSGAPLGRRAELLCRELGERAIDAGFRVATGGLGGVMRAVSHGAHRAQRYREGDVVGVLPGAEGARANPYVDIAIPTGLGMARNVLVVSMADVVVAVAGSSGTLSEMAFAWQLGKPLIALAPAGGWAAELAGRRLDERRPDRVLRADSPEQAVRLALEATTGTRG